MPKQPLPEPTASEIGPCPTIIQIVRRPALEVYTGPSHHHTLPLKYHCQLKVIIRLAIR